MPCMNSRYHCNSLQSLHFIDITHIECTQRSRDRDPTLHQVAEANYVWVQTSLTNGLRSLIQTHALHEGTSRLTGTSWLGLGLSLHSSSSMKNPPSGSVGSSKT